MWWCVRVRIRGVFECYMIIAIDLRLSMPSHTICFLNLSKPWQFHYIFSLEEAVFLRALMFSFDPPFTSIYDFSLSFYYSLFLALPFLLSLTFLLSFCVLHPPPYLTSCHFLCRFISSSLSFAHLAYSRPPFPQTYEMNHFLVNFRSLHTKFRK